MKKLFILLLIFCFKIYSNQVTPLMVACKNGDLSEVQSLLYKKVNVNENTGDEEFPGETALMFAAKAGQEKIVDELIKAGADVNAVAWQDFPWLGKHVLSYAIDGGSVAVINALIGAGANVNSFTNSSNNLDQTPEMLRARNISIIMYAVYENAPRDIIAALIKAGAIINNFDLNVSLTPLFVAVFLNKPQMVKDLIELGAHKNCKDKYGKTALDYAKERGYSEIELMLQDGWQDTLNNIFGRLVQDVINHIINRTQSSTPQLPNTKI